MNQETLNERLPMIPPTSNQAGWFRLKNGEKSLVYLTDRSRVVYLPTRDGYYVMLSTPQPEALIAALQQVAVRSRIH